ncbi:MAG TPA: glycosyltransferase [Alloacidobacterium sp.]|nr:glycosyltransferase [Alloacidobacterium sp.]
MTAHLVRNLFLGISAIPSIYYAIALVSVVRFFQAAPAEAEEKSGFEPPASILKPVRGLDPGAYENFASFCRQDYPDYEILFCVGDTSDPAFPLLEQVVRDFPERRIRILIGSGREAANDKVAKLVRLVDEASHEYLVISDSDVRVKSNYLRKTIAPLANPKIGATTCFYVPIEDTSWVQRLQDVGMLSDFYPGILVAKQLDGVKFALGPTIATTRTRLQAFGGYSSLENRPADDLMVGRLIADQGYDVEILPYSISTVPDYQSLSDLFHKRLRWITVMRHMRPWGHLGLIFTLGLPWALLAVALHPTFAIAMGYLGGYLAFRMVLTALVGAWGLRQRGVWKKMPLIPLWDGLACLIWLVSFLRRSIRWRGQNYLIRDGVLVPTP